MTTAAEFLDVAGIADDDDPNQSANDAILARLKRVLTEDWDTHPRSLQRAIGPSEIGHPCARQIAAKVTGVPAVNPGGDPLPAWLGTAGHAKLEDAFNSDNARVLEHAQNHPGTEARTTTDPITGEEVGPWITERRLEIAPGLSGTCDLFARLSGTVVDHKFVGASAASKYRKFGPPEHYRVQAHLYGLGYRNAGYRVERVAIWFIPRASFLSKAWVWSEPFDASIAEAAIDRLEKIRTAVEALNARENHEALSLVPATESGCRFCPFFSAAPVEGVWSCQGR
jgi:hypothetical protein